MFDSVRPHRRKPTRLRCLWDSPGKNTGVGCHFLLQCMKVKSESEVAQSCPTLSDPMDCSLPGSSIHGIFQARVLEWGAIAFSVTEPLGGENFYSPIMYETCILNMLQQVGWSPQLLESRLRTEVRTHWYSQGPSHITSTAQSNLLSFGSPRFSPKLFLQIQVPRAQTWGPSGSVCSAVDASVISVFSWSHFQYLCHQQAPAVAYHQHGPCSQNQSA